jgi:hypothetical protein
MNAQKALVPICGLMIAGTALIAMQSQAHEAEASSAFRAQHLCIVDFLNDRYQINFPIENDSVVRFSTPSGVYVSSVPSPNGRDLFAISRGSYDGGADAPRDVLVRRRLEGAVGPEEVVSTPFRNYFQLSISPNERFVIAAARATGMREGKDQGDAIYLMDLQNNAFLRVADYHDAGKNDTIRNLNVNDSGNMVVYEEAGTVLRYTRGANGGFTVEDRHAGEFPVLLPTGGAYLFLNHGHLVRSEGSKRTDLVPIPAGANTLRISPDGRWAFFRIRGVGGSMPWSLSQYMPLRICNLMSLACFDRPDGIDRQAFWIIR